MITGIPTYAVQFAVDYPDRELDRLTTFSEVATRHPPLHRAGLPRYRICGGDQRPGRNPRHRPLPALAVRLRRGRHALAQPGDGLRARARHGRVSTVPPPGLVWL